MIRKTLGGLSIVSNTRDKCPATWELLLSTNNTARNTGCKQKTKQCICCRLGLYTDKL